MPNHEIPSQEINMEAMVISHDWVNAIQMLDFSLKRNHFKRKSIIFQPSIFRGCVSLLEANLLFGICHTKHLYAQTG